MILDFYSQVLKIHVFDNLVQNLAWNWHKVHQSLSNFPSSFNNCLKNFPTFPTSLQGKGRSFPFLIGGSEEGHLPVSQSQHSRSPSFSCQQAYRENYPIPVTGVKYGTQYYEAHILQYQLSQQKRGYSGLHVLSPFVLKVLDLGSKEGFCPSCWSINSIIWESLLV